MPVRGSFFSACARATRPATDETSTLTSTCGITPPMASPSACSAVTGKSCITTPCSWQSACDSRSSISSTTNLSGTGCEKGKGEGVGGGKKMNFFFFFFVWKVMG